MGAQHRLTPNFCPFFWAGLVRCSGDITGGFSAGFVYCLAKRRTAQPLTVALHDSGLGQFAGAHFCLDFAAKKWRAVEQALVAIGFSPDGMNILYTPTAVAIGLVYAYLPFMVLPIYTSLEKIDWRLFEAALDLGATRWVTLRRIVIPLAMPGIVAGCLLVFVPALGAYYIPELLGGGKQMMIGSLIQAQFGTGRNWPFGSALAFALLGLVLLGMLLYARRYQRERDAA